MTYEIEVCPFCGAQVSYDGGYDGYGYVFDCEHDSWMDEYGSVEPIKVPVVPRGLRAALTAAAPRLAKQREEKAETDAERKAAEDARWNALTAEQQQSELERRQMMADSLRRMAEATMRLYTEQGEREAFWRGRTAVIPTDERKVNEN